MARAIADDIGLKNVVFQHGDIGECHTRFNYVVSRAVMRLDELVPLIKNNISTKRSGNLYGNGLICLKGGDLDYEISNCRRAVFDEPLSVYFNEPFFNTKSLIYVPFENAHTK